MSKYFESIKQGLEEAIEFSKGKTKKTTVEYISRGCEIKIGKPMSETEYLTSSVKNKQRLDSSIAKIKAGDVIEKDLIEDYE